MHCPTCDHTLARLCGHEDMNFFHCDRCGTVVVKIETPGNPDRVYRPELVERCRVFGATIFVESPRHFDEWQRLGIAESIHPAADRPQGG